VTRKKLASTCTWLSYVISNVPASEPQNFNTLAGTRFCARTWFWTKIEFWHISQELNTHIGDFFLTKIGKSNTG